MIPQSLDEHISEENPIRVIDAFVNQLDLVKLEIRFAVAPRIGRSPYDPKDKIKLYIYGYLNGIRSSRKLEKETNRNIEVMWLFHLEPIPFIILCSYFFRVYLVKAYKNIDI